MPIVRKIASLFRVDVAELGALGAEDAASWPEGVLRAVAVAVGGIVALCAARMVYVVWRDIDIVRLRLIDGAAARESDERERALADEKSASIRGANVRPVEVKAPKAWGECSNLAGNPEGWPEGR